MYRLFFKRLIDFVAALCGLVVLFFSLADIWVMFQKEFLSYGLYELKFRVYSNNTCYESKNHLLC